MAIAENILATLERFDSIEFGTLRDEVLRGVHTTFAEEQFKLALTQLKAAGTIVAPNGIFGRLMLAKRAGVNPQREKPKPRRPARAD